MSTVLLLHGHAARLPLGAASVHTICTSPPFYGLRQYDGLAPTPWPGGTCTLVPGLAPVTLPGPLRWEDLDTCAHTWQPYVIPPPGHTDDGATGSTLQGGKATQAQTQRTPTIGATCARCEAIQCCLGNEPTLELYLWHMVLVLRELWRVLRPDGVLWLNLGDTWFGDSPVRMQSAEAFAPTWDKGQTRSRGGTRRSAARLPGFTPGSLLLVPYRVALAAEAEGWLLRQDCVVAKQAPMPESVHGWQHTGTTLRRGSWRHTRAHEAMLMLTKGMHYFANGDAVREEGGTGWKASMFDSPYKTATQRRLGQQPREETPGRNPRSVLTPTPTPLHLPHYAAFPPSLIEPLLRATCPERVCGACGAPWAPVVTRQRLLDGTTPVAGAFAAPDAPYRAPANGIAHTRYSTTHTLEGLAPTCACQQQGCIKCGFVLELPHDRTKSPLQAMRRDIPAHEQTPTADLLHNGMLSPCAEPERPATEGSQPSLENVPTLSNTVPARNQARPDLLQQAMLPSSHGDALSSTLSPMREDIYTGEESPDLLQQEVFSDCDSAEQTQQPGMVCNNQGVYSHLPATPSQCDPNRLCDGTPSSDGEGTRAVSGSGRSRPPSQRRQGRQPRRKSPSDAQADTRQPQATDLHGDLSELPACFSDQGPCPHCGSPLVLQPPPTKPGICLDPFSGSGTTALVARALGRDAVALDASPTYLTLARERLSLDALDAWTHGRPVPTRALAELPLFAGLLDPASDPEPKGGDAQPA